MIKIGIELNCIIKCNLAILIERNDFYFFLENYYFFFHVFLPTTESYAKFKELVYL